MMTLRFVAALEILFLLLTTTLLMSTMSNAGEEIRMKFSFQYAGGTEPSQNQIVNLTAEERPVYENVNITMERGLCLGWCPHYYLEMHGDGTIIYRGFNFVNVTGERKSHIDPAIVTELVAEFYRKGFFNLSDRYEMGEKTCLSATTSQPYVSVSIMVNSTSKTVSDYMGCSTVPSQLRYLEDRIDNVTNSSQWIEPRTEESLQEEFYQDR
jgi:hypothetical protein